MIKGGCRANYKAILYKLKKGLSDQQINCQGDQLKRTKGSTDQLIYLKEQGAPKINWSTIDHLFNVSGLSKQQIN